MRRIAAALLLSGLLCVGGAAEEYPLYSWPLESFNGFSSGFQEFRSSHFHAGIDLRTMKQTGWPVHSIGDGEVFRLRVVQNDSGLGLYVRHSDGFTAFYCHLERFAPALQALVEAERRRSGRPYFGNLDLPTPVPVARGEIIAYSGESGVGFAHLHLEIRDPQGRAVHPLRCLVLPQPPKLEPMMTKLVVRSVGATRLDGRPGELVLPMQKVGEEYTTERSFLADGPFEPIISAFVFTDGEYSTAPYSLAAELDGEPFFQLTLNRFSGDDNNQLGMVYDVFYSRPFRLFFNLFQQTGYTLETLQRRFSALFAALPPGPHTLRVTVGDVCGGVVHGTIPFEKVAQPRILLEDGADGGRRVRTVGLASTHRLELTWLDERRQVVGQRVLSAAEAAIGTAVWPLAGQQAAWLDASACSGGVCYLRRRLPLAAGESELLTTIDFSLYLNGDEAVVVVPQVTQAAVELELQVGQGETARIVPAEDLPQGVMFRFHPPAGDAPLPLSFRLLQGGRVVEVLPRFVRLLRLEPGQAAVARVGELTLRFAERSVYEPRLWQITPRLRSTFLPQVSPPVELAPAYRAFLDEVTAEFRPASAVGDLRQVAVAYCHPGDGNWRFLPTTRSVDGAFRSRVRLPGLYALLRDDRPPEIKPFKPASRRRSEIQELIVEIGDVGLGVDASSVRLRLNGRVLSAEYDADWGRVKIIEVERLRKGRNTLRVEAADLGGNRTGRTFKFTLK